MPATAACTIVAKPCLSYARVLARSFHRFHPDVPFYVLLADEIDEYFNPVAEGFALVALADLDIPRLERFRFTYAQQPLSYACTPYLLDHLERLGFARVVFFKQETLVLGDLGSLFDRLDTASVVLTPHLVNPLGGPDREARELNILQSGAFNVGVLGVARGPETKRFLRWWQDRLSTHCRHDVAHGMHFEQRWLDLAPAFFGGVHVLRDTAYNVGHWNLPERRVEVGADDSVRVDGEPCRVFRFSGYDPDSATGITRYNERLGRKTAGQALKVFERFDRELMREGYRETSHWPYAYADFDNGVPVPDVARLLYAEGAGDVTRFGDPLRTAPGTSFWRWLNGPADGLTARCRVSRLWHAVYSSRPDLQQAFPDLSGPHAEPFLAWAAQHGIHEHQVSARLLDQVRA